MSRKWGCRVSRLLIDEHPLQVLPSLAEELGLKQAIVLQQIHYWLGRSNQEYQGRIWFYKTPEAWVRKKPKKAGEKKGELRFLSKKTLDRILDFLEKKNLIIRKSLGTKFGKNSFDRVTYFTIDYDEMAKLEAKIFSEDEFVETAELTDSPFSQNDQMGAEPSKPAFSQNDQIDVPTLTKSIESKRPNRISQNDEIRFSQNDQMITENKTEITSEREALPVIAPPNLFAMDTTVNKKFPMTESWQPTEKFGSQCKFRNVNLGALALDDQEDLINEFRSYWMTQDTQLNQSGWEHKLIGSLKRSQERKSGTGRNPQSFKGGKFSSAHGDMNW